MGLDNLLAALERRPIETYDTPCNLGEVLAKHAPMRACTLDTPDTPQYGNTGNEVREVITSDTAASCWWRLHYSDWEAVEIAYYPSATHAEVLAGEPNAIEAEPFKPIPGKPGAPLTAEDETVIRAWLAHIEETDPATISDVVNQCQLDADAREYFIQQGQRSAATAQLKLY